ncbi:hypothetical protein UPYG_G00060810 [Umbra pygmaea]|uniref:Uncharacterized protein n=1 Tax=Umbra pygmaea TaxID=75934 RepID=A0ABD0XWR2_UMBPY
MICLCLVGIAPDVRTETSSGPHTVRARCHDSDVVAEGVASGVASASPGCGPAAVSRPGPDGVSHEEEEKYGGNVPAQCRGGKTGGKLWKRENRPATATPQGGETYLSTHIPRHGHYTYKCMLHSHTHPGTHTEPATHCLVLSVWHRLPTHRHAPSTGTLHSFTMIQ